MKTHEEQHGGGRRGLLHSKLGLVLAVFLAALGLLIIYEHRSHVLSADVLLILLLVVCVGSHFFLHGRHGGHGGGSGDD